MNNVRRVLKSQRGFMLLNVVFLTLITAFAATILLNAAPRVKNPQPTLRLTAYYLANEQLAQLEALAAKGESIDGISDFRGVDSDRFSKNLGKGISVEFKVQTTVSVESANLRTVKVIVTWTVDDKNFELAAERMIRIVPKQTL